MTTKRSPNPTDKYVGSRLRMRRLMLGMSQERLGGALGITFQQVQKYEKGTNRISASRLQHVSHILRIPVVFFFEGVPNVPGQPDNIANIPSPTYVSDFLATSDGLALTEAFMRIKNSKLRRCIVDLVEQMVGREDR
jgi:transcriptional regulator with XRE-family HTH domain